MTFMWSNCAAPEITVKSDLLSHLSRQLGEGQLCDVDPPPVLLPVHPVMGWEQAWVPSLQEEDTVSLAIAAAGWWLLGSCQHTPYDISHSPGGSGSQTFSCPGPPSSWSTTKVGLKKECSGVLWVASSRHAHSTAFRTMQFSSKHCNPGSIRRWRYLAIVLDEP